MRLSLSRCISFDSYIKPQLDTCRSIAIRVVYLVTPTSNHNGPIIVTTTIRLYIFWLLHQTTTSYCTFTDCCSCISFDSYIKPQHTCLLRHRLGVVYLLTPTSNHNHTFATSAIIGLYIFWLLHQTTTRRASTTILCSCISFDSYIKPQPIGEYGTSSYVVYLLTPTSNHNRKEVQIEYETLYIFWLLHQTTTAKVSGSTGEGCISFDSYIKPQPAPSPIYEVSRCISFDSYIKPQLNRCADIFESVVYLLTPTSNHNWRVLFIEESLVVYLLTPTSNHNLSYTRIKHKELYIFWLLHQTTTAADTYGKQFGCISFDSYIKPQLGLYADYRWQVVYLLTPTSNHNCICSIFCCYVLYIFWLLHQTTTSLF